MHLRKLRFLQMARVEPCMEAHHLRPLVKTAISGAA